MRPDRPHHRTRWVLTVDERAAFVVGHGLLQGLAEPDRLQQLVPGLQRVAALLARAGTKRWRSGRWRWRRRWTREGCRRRRRRRRRERHSGLHPCRKTDKKQAVRLVVRDHYDGRTTVRRWDRRSEGAVWHGRAVRVLCWRHGGAHHQ